MALEDGYVVTDDEFEADQRYASIAKDHGMSNSLRALWEARHYGISPSLALAILEQESGGDNVFGHDPTIFIGAGTVTADKYFEYRRQRRASGNRLMQGVGPMQLTWWEFQDGADRLGGCWIPKYNIRYGMKRLADLIDQYGTWEGVERYNGSGPNAEIYRQQVKRKYDAWHDRLT
jgi:soluble lytic murein transglycosylase-like protein